MEIHKTYKYKLRLSPSQERTITEWIHTCRYIYNLALETKMYSYKAHGVSLSAFDLMKQMTLCRKEYEWVKAVSVGCLEGSIKHMDSAYKSFFRGGGYPKYAHRDRYNSITFKSIRQISDYVFKLPKLGKVRVFKDRLVQGDLRRATVIKEADGFYLCILTKQQVSVSAKPLHDSQVIGLDMGLAYFLSTSDGIQIDNPRHTLKYEKQLRIEQRSLARKKKGSKSRDKQKLVVQKLHQKIARVRKDFLHKLSKQFVDKYGLISVEDLKVSNMIKFGYLGKHIADASWSEFFGQLEYKAEWYGSTLIKVDPKYTSQTCSECGCIDSRSRKSQSEFECVECKFKGNADVNASIEILKRGLDKAVIREREAVVCA